MDENGYIFSVIIGWLFLTWFLFRPRKNVRKELKTLTRIKSTPNETDEFIRRTLPDKLTSKDFFKGHSGE